MNNENNTAKLPCMETCEAPLCPAAGHDKAQWFPDEAICHAKTTDKPAWIKIQRKIKRRFLKGLIAGDEACFTIPMLQAMKAVRRPKGMRPEDLYRNGTGQARQNT